MPQAYARSIASSIGPSMCREQMHGRTDVRTDSRVLTFRNHLTFLNAREKPGNLRVAVIRRTWQPTQPQETENA